MITSLQLDVDKNDFHPHYFYHHKETCFVLFCKFQRVSDVKVEY